jgi:hypothetical protein
VTRYRLPGMETLNRAAIAAHATSSEDKAIDVITRCVKQCGLRAAARGRTQRRQVTMLTAMNYRERIVRNQRIVGGEPVLRAHESL